MLFYIIIAISLAALVSTWALKYFEGRRSDEVDQGSAAFGSKSSHIWAKRSSSRRKAIYKKNSQLNDYLEKNLSKGGNSDNIQFQSNFPWKTYVQNSRYEGKIAGLDPIELKLYESIFEIILTEKSYLTVRGLKDKRKTYQKLTFTHFQLANGAPNELRLVSSRVGPSHFQIRSQSPFWKFAQSF